jgi:DNA-binding NtrC family response regulator
MRKQPGTASNITGTLTVLSVSPLQEDHRSLQAILGHSTWNLFNADQVPPALDFLDRHEISVVLCERDLMPGTWIDMLENIRRLSHPPSLIVTSRLADERLWSEALNLGAWDVLAKPFDRSEVFRSVKSGWQHWHDQIHLRVAAMNSMRAAS